MYYEPGYEPAETEILAAFRVTPQPGASPEEAAAAVAAESSTGTWTSVWTDRLTTLERYKACVYRLEPIPGQEGQWLAYVAYPLEELRVSGSISTGRAAEIEEAIWERMHFASHLRQQRLGEFTVGTDLCRSESLGLVQLLILYHLVTARAVVALGGGSARAPEAEPSPLSPAGSH